MTGEDGGDSGMIDRKEKSKKERGESKRVNGLKSSSSALHNITKLKNQLSDIMHEPPCCA